MTIEIGDNELQSIKKLEKELQDFQTLHVEITGDDNFIQKTVNKIGGSALVYTKTEETISKLIKKLEKDLKKFLKENNIKGKLFGKKAMEKYLDNSERVDKSLSELRKINKMNAEAARRRLKVALAELKKHTGILAADIDIFIKNAKSLGYSSKEILRMLVRDGANKVGMVQAFAKRLKSIASTLALRERKAAKIEEYTKEVGRTALWQWITISIKPCPDCIGRAGRVMTIEQWMGLGLPGAGRTVCGKRCYCDLIPWVIARDIFPTVKVFDWNPKDGVLTTPGEARILNALKNQPKQEKKK